MSNDFHTYGDKPTKTELSQPLEISASVEIKGNGKVGAFAARKNPINSESNPVPSVELPNRVDKPLRRSAAKMRHENSQLITERSEREKLQFKIAKDEVGADCASLSQAQGAKTGATNVPNSSESKDNSLSIQDPSEDSIPLLTTDVFDGEPQCRRIYRIGNIEVPNLTEVSVTEDSDTAARPNSIGYVGATITLDSGHASFKTKVYICVDTGADITVCTNRFLTQHFNDEAEQLIRKTGFKDPDLKSATGHPLVALGTVPLQITIGTYTFNADVLVYAHETSTFLLGNDCIYNRLIYNAGKTISFVEEGHEPVPLRYFKPFKQAATINFCSLAPHSSSLVEVRVGDPNSVPNQTVMLSPIENESVDTDHSIYRIAHAVSTVAENGTAYAWIENNTDDQLDIPPNSFIADVVTVSDQVNSIIKEAIDQQARLEKLNKNDLQKEATSYSNENWSLAALHALKHRLPVSLRVNWSQLTKGVTDPTDPLTDIKGFSKPDLSGGKTVNLIHDKIERAQFIDGTGVEFPSPCAHELSDLPSDPTNSEWIENIDRAHLSPDQWTLLKDLILRKSRAFAKHKGDIGCYNGFKIHLPLKPGTGYLYQKPRTLNSSHKALADEHVNELLQQGIIRPSNSPHATNVVIVSKKSGPGEPPKSRMCIDLREVNQHSVPNRFPNLSLDDSLKKIQGSKFRSSFDFNQAFHQLVLDEESIPVTAFYVGNVLYEHVRLPFGHVVAMQNYCSLMAILCHNYPSACYYADDLVVVTMDDPTKPQDELFRQHIIDIEGMLERIIDANLKLSAHKCQWAYDSSRPMDWLGFTLANNLLRPLEAKIEAVQKIPRPTSARQALSFVSLASFYRRFISNFARIAQPLYEVGKLDKKEPFLWTDAAEAAFETLKDALCSTDAVLRLPRMGEPYYIYTDASWGSLGCVLCQIDPKDGKLHPCAYGSRKFNNTEINYSTPLKEFLAILYSLNLWVAYVDGCKVVILSDCKAWTFLKAQSVNSHKVSRHAVQIQEYDIEIKYVAGKKNKAADGLSRMYDTGEVKFDNVLANKDPLFELLGAPQLHENQQVTKEVYLELCQVYLDTVWPKLVEKYNERRRELNLGQVQASGVYQCTSYDLDPNDPEGYIVNQASHQGGRAVLGKEAYFTEFSHPFLGNKAQVNENPSAREADLSGFADPSDSGYRIHFVSINDSVFSREAFIELQLQDPFCSEKIRKVKEKSAVDLAAGFFLKKKVLMRHMTSQDGHQFDVVCVPISIVRSLLDSTHGNLLVGHFGSRRYLANMKSKYFWPSMKKDILAFHKQCIPCQMNDKFPVKYKAGQTLKPDRPNSLVFIDLAVGLPRSQDGYYCILMVYCGFSRFAAAIPLKSEKADYVVKQFMTQYVGKYGMPEHVHSDNGRNMDSSLIRHLCLMLGAVKTSTPYYTPRSNSSEVICGAIVQLIRKGLMDSDKRYWPLCLPFVVNAYNSTIHTATGYTPNSLFLGRFDGPSPVPLVPFDCEAANVNDYYRKLRRFQELAFQIVKMRNERLSKIRKDQMDKNAITPNFKIGEYVLVKNLQPGKGPGQVKLRPKYIGPFRIIKVYPTSLALVPWSVNPQLELFYKDSDLFRIAHRGDVPLFRVQISAIKDCKPYKGPVESQVVVDPITIGEFLDSLELDHQKEFTFMIDPDQNLAGDDWHPDAMPPVGTSSVTSVAPGSILSQPPEPGVMPDNSSSSSSSGNSSGPGSNPGFAEHGAKSDESSSLLTPSSESSLQGNSASSAAAEEDKERGNSYAPFVGSDSTPIGTNSGTSSEPYIHIPGTTPDPNQPESSIDSLGSANLDLSFTQKEAMRDLKRRNPRRYAEEKLAFRQFKQERDLEDRLSTVYDDLYALRRFRRLAEYSDIEIEDLERLAASADPLVRRKAAADLAFLLDEVYKEAIREQEYSSPAHSLTDEDNEVIPVAAGSRHFRSEIARKQMLVNAGKRITREAERLVAAGPRSQAVRQKMFKKLKKVSANLERAKRHAGFAADDLDCNCASTDGDRELGSSSSPGETSSTTGSSQPSSRAATSPEEAGGSTPSQTPVEAEKRKPSSVAKQMLKDRLGEGRLSGSNLRLPRPRRAPPEKMYNLHFSGGARADASSPSSSDSSRTAESASKTLTPGRSKDLEWDDYEANARVLPRPDDPLGKRGPSNDRFSNPERPYRGPRDAINRWIEEGFEVYTSEKPKVTRFGRQVKPIRRYSPTGELEREKELRARLNAAKEAERPQQEATDDDPGSDTSATSGATISVVSSAGGNYGSEHDEGTQEEEVIPEGVRRSPRIAAKAAAEGKAAVIEAANTAHADTPAPQSAHQRRVRIHIPEDTDPIVDIRPTQGKRVIPPEAKSASTLAREMLQKEIAASASPTLKKSTVQEPVSSPDNETEDDA